MIPRGKIPIFIFFFFFLFSSWHREVHGRGVPGGVAGSPHARLFAARSCEGAGGFDPQRVQLGAEKQRLFPHLSHPGLSKPASHSTRGRPVPTPAWPRATPAT